MQLTTQTTRNEFRRTVSPTPDRYLSGPDRSAIASRPAPPIKREVAASAEFDGVICFGGVDWWYHNRGHFDLQMMKQMSQRVPVLYVNSIGMRVPRVSEGRMFLRRVLRKLKSVRRGFTSVNDRFGVLSPFTAPGQCFRSLTRPIVRWQIRAACKRMGINKPLIWIACPPAVEFIEAIEPVGVVYQRTDRFESFPGIDTDRITQHDQKLKQRADLTLFCSSLLFDNEASHCCAAGFVDHGVDYERFAKAGESSECDPVDCASIPHPRVGFVGGIDDHTFDPELFVETARRLPGMNFVMVGACSLPDGWCDQPNVHFLGRKPYEQVCDYMAACDVLIMPWNQGEWIQACNPVKMKEYLASGRPVVSTWFPEVDQYASHIRVAKNACEFATQIVSAVNSPGDARARMDRVKNETWLAKAESVLEMLKTGGLLPSKGLSHE